jgi:hypothetical protein
MNSDDRFPERKAGSEIGFDQFGQFTKSLSDDNVLRQQNKVEDFPRARNE